ncbi:sensor histidine kinase [Amycolatopsis thermoflava]|uniref:sensor histidine kinase n=1 Tax=Amycolatopsis thermoflava TaxID=84480 RepID=UPI003EB6C083
MLLGWVGRAVGDRFGPARLLPLVIGPGYLLLVQRPEPTPADWVVVFAAAGVFLAGGVWPLAVAGVESLLILAAHQWADATPVAVKVLAGVAVFELAIRRAMRTALLGAAVLTAVYFVLGTYDHVLTGVLAVGYRVLTVVGGPLLLGAYLRAGVRAVAQASARAEEAEARRELAARGARLTERTEIARELHDLVAHHVASMALRVGVARAVVPDLDPRVGEVLDDVHASATRTLADLRELVSALRDPASVRDHGVLIETASLPAAVESVIGRSRQAGLAIDCHVDPAIAALDSLRGLAVLRLVQESLTNVAKHAGPGARAHVRVDAGGGQVLVEVTDTGGARGGGGEPGYGLVGLRERVDLVGGTLEAGPHGDGWRVRALIPAETSAPVDSEVP